MLTPLVVAIVGLIVWWVPMNPKVNETGRYLFIIGTVFTLYALSGRH